MRSENVALGARGTLFRGLGVVLTLVALTAAPAFLEPYLLFLGAKAMIFSIAGLGLTVLVGWTGQIALAQAGFVGIGAYGTAVLSSVLGLPWPLAVAVSSVFATACGLVVGMPAARLRGFYLAIATLAFGQLAVRAFIVAPFTGGNNGLPVQLVRIGNLGDATIWYLALITTVGAFLAVWRIGHTRLGRVLRAVRDAEIASGALGISASRYKLVAFAISACLGSLAGALYSQLLTFLTPPIFDLDLLIVLLVMVFIGGASRLAGPLVGAVFVIALIEQLQDFGTAQRFAYAAILIAAIRVLPGGLASLPAFISERWFALGPGKGKPPDDFAPAPER